MDQYEYEEVLEWYGKDKKDFEDWELVRAKDCYNSLVQFVQTEDGTHEAEKSLIAWLETVLF